MSNQCPPRPVSRLQVALSARGGAASVVLEPARPATLDLAVLDLVVVVLEVRRLQDHGLVSVWRTSVRPSLELTSLGHSPAPHASVTNEQIKDALGGDPACRAGPYSVVPFLQTSR